MIELIKALILAEIKIDPVITHIICQQAKGNTHYSLVYELTYGQLAPQTDDLVTLMTENQFTSGKKIMEIMSGNGYETHALQAIFPEHHYSCLDLTDNYRPIKGLTYVKADCTDPNYRHPQQQDLIFIGSANASMCMLLSLKELLRLGVFLQHNVSITGIAVLSYFEEHKDFSNFTVDYSVQIISNFHDSSCNGLYAHWFSVAKYDIETQLHHYYDLVAVTADAELSQSTNYKTIVYHTEPFLARSWQSAVVMEVMAAAGFEYVGNKWNPDSRFMPFQKIIELHKVTYF